MAREDVEVVRQAFDAVTRRDKSLWLSVCDPAIEDVPPSDWPESRPIRGPDAIWDFYAETLEPWEDAAFNYTELIDAGHNRVLARIIGELRGRTSGAPVTWDFWQVVEIRDRKALLRIEWFAKRGEAVEALGRSA